MRLLSRRSGLALSPRSVGGAAVSGIGFDDTDCGDQRGDALVERCRTDAVRRAQLGERHGMPRRIMPFNDAAKRRIRAASHLQIHAIALRQSMVGVGTLTVS